jgi:hypothetical protein
MKEQTVNAVLEILVSLEAWIDKLKGGEEISLLAVDLLQAIQTDGNPALKLSLARKLKRKLALRRSSKWQEHYFGHMIWICSMLAESCLEIHAVNVKSGDVIVDDGSAHEVIDVRYMDGACDPTSKDKAVLIRINVYDADAGAERDIDWFGHPRAETLVCVWRQSPEQKQEILENAEASLTRDLQKKYFSSRDLEVIREHLKICFDKDSDLVPNSEQVLNLLEVAKLADDSDVLEVWQVGFLIDLCAQRISVLEARLEESKYGSRPLSDASEAVVREHIERLRDCIEPYLRAVIKAGDRCAFAIFGLHDAFVLKVAMRLKARDENLYAPEGIRRAIWGDLRACMSRLDEWYSCLCAGDTEKAGSINRHHHHMSASAAFFMPEGEALTAAAYQTQETDRAFERQDFGALLKVRHWRKADDYITDCMTPQKGSLRFFRGVLNAEQDMTNEPGVACIWYPVATLQGALRKHVGLAVVTAELADKDPDAAGASLREQAERLRAEAAEIRRDFEIIDRIDPREVEDTYNNIVKIEVFEDGSCSVVIRFPEDKDFEGYSNVSRTYANIEQAFFGIEAETSNRKVFSLMPYDMMGARLSEKKAASKLMIYGEMPQKTLLSVMPLDMRLRCLKGTKSETVVIGHSAEHVDRDIQVNMFNEDFYLGKIYNYLDSLKSEGSSYDQAAIIDALEGDSQFMRRLIVCRRQGDSAEEWQRRFELDVDYASAPFLEKLQAKRLRYHIGSFFASAEGMRLVGNEIEVESCLALRSRVGSLPLD